MIKLNQVKSGDKKVREKNYVWVGCIVKCLHQNSWEYFKYITHVPSRYQREMSEDQNMMFPSTKMEYCQLITLVI